MSSRDQPEASARRQVTVRPTPRLSPFLVIGVLAAAAAAVVVVLVTGPADDYTAAGSLVYLTVAFALPGLALGAVAWLLIDRRSRKRTRTYDLQKFEAPGFDAAERTPAHGSD
ncbi:hypothetical protein [Nesterenkonia lutea]|uniref:Peptidoglycan/LPS O-acetylase OafA/YrhL n=1 Tax=Nesterenkonia lutea TaxID=272919 RepID=A0ABR9JHW7_9MICC|nr:hypothetical protein [Nesterenkonia lutea]MBE1525416.1 peptidoglycan/LPS O-acetylase OafA/YrhL [Nesterenkonia lutea]